jgi:predicted RNA methylase
MNLHERVLGMLQQILVVEELRPEAKLYRALRLLAKYRSELIAQELVRGGGLSVRSGPFAGMTMGEQRTEGCLVPKILGCYEQELHGILRELPARGYEAVLDIGCAEGYYAIGLALLLPEAEVWAYDMEDSARRTCAALAERNGVSGRVHIGERFALEDFRSFADRHVLVACDIEGGEVDLMDPEAAPALRRMDVLVELHDCFDPTISQRIVERFETSHEVRFVEAGARNAGGFPELAKLEHLDQLLALWEWRTGPTPWAFMTAKER